MTRNDARDFLTLAAQIHLQPHVRTFTLERATEALDAIRSDEVDGAAVIVPN
jgi:propanol-preferring alcohol dehydrogenase